MKYFDKLFLIVFFCFFSNLSYAEKIIITYIDMDKIMNNSTAGKKFTKSLEDLHKSNIEKYKKIEKSLKDKENKILSQKNVLNKDEFNNKVSDLRAEAKDYRDQRTDSINKLNDMRLKGTSKLINLFNPILAEYSKENNISMILQKKSIVIGKPEKNFFDLAIRDLSCNKNEIIMVGDDIKSDIEGAKKNNIR